ncbi:MAG: hypothetical protein RL226_535 [Bacteroidota bacterium]
MVRHSVFFHRQTVYFSREHSGFSLVLLTMKKIIIAGGTGLVGRHIRELATGNYTVRVLTRNENTSDPDSIYWNPEKGVVPYHEISSADVVVNLSGESVNQRWSSAAKERILSSRTVSTAALVDAINAADKSIHLINASASGIYENSQELQSETSILGNDFLAHVCRKWEAEASRLSDRHALTIVRIGVVLDQHGGALQKLLPIFKLGLGSAIGSGKQWMSWIHAKDLGMAILHLADKHCAGIYNLCAPMPVTNSEFGKALASALKKPYFLPPVPSFVLKIITGEMSAIILNSKKLNSQKLVDSGYTFQYPRIEGAMKDIVE